MYRDSFPDSDLIPHLYTLVLPSQDLYGHG
jgi:hypothetical protein